MGQEKGESQSGEPAGFHTTPKRESTQAGDQPAFATFSAERLTNGIEVGTITDPQAVRVLVQKEFDLQRTANRGDTLSEIEARYKPLLAGKASALSTYSREKADQAITLGSEAESDSPNYAAAAGWYDMAARFAHEAARTEPQGKKIPSFSSQKVLESIISRSGPPSEEMTRSFQTMGKMQAILSGIESGTITDPEAVYDLVGWSVEMERTLPIDDALRKKAEERLAPQVYGDPKDMIAYCLNAADGQRNIIYLNDEKAAHWYTMAARIARQALNETTP